MKHHNPHILEGNIPRGVLSLSAPIIIGMFFQSLLNIVDTFWVGKISSIAVAAVSISWPVIFILIALSAGASTGVNALVSKCYGAKDYNLASLIAKNGIILGLIISLVLTIAGILLSTSLFNFLGATGEVLDLALDYSYVVFYGTVFFIMSFVLSSVLRATGDTKTPMKVGIAVNIVNIILDPIFIFVFGLGVTGVAIATIISSFLATAFYFWYLASGHSHIHINFKQLEYKANYIIDILKIGFPAALRNISNSIGVFFTLKVIATYGAAAVAAYGIAFRVESFGVLPVVAIATGAVTMVGQNLGANNLTRAKLSGWVSAGIGASMMAVFGFFVFFVSSSIISLFNNEPEVIKIGSEVLKIKSPAFLFSALVMTLGAAFNGFGKSQYALIITIIRVALMIWFIYLFNDLFGLTGVWWGIVFSGILSAIANVVWYFLYKPKEALNNA